MELDLGPDASAFRDEVRGWLEANRPDELVGVEVEPGAARGNPALEAWAEKLHRAGLMCVAWPKEFGGRGLTGVEVAVLNEEFARAGVPRLTRGMGEGLVGPSIIVWGTDEQKAHFLPRIIDGTDRYCQGFSEPNAGSDLAGLTTRGVVDGDEIVVTGQKVWTSGAQAANVMFCLCRTDPEAPKHEGISYVLVPMRREDGSSNGFELRPIRQITGASRFTETFITEARAPRFNVIGGLHEGWRVAMTTLGNERGGNATTQHVQHRRQFDRAVDEVRKRGRAEDALVRQQLAWAYTHCEIMRYQGLRTLSQIVARREPGPASALNKMFWSEYARRFAEIVMDIRGTDSTILPPQQPGAYEPDRWQRSFLSTRSGTIWGGTAEIQRNIVGERVLGLPKEPAAR
ncbi:MAG TPA: acyl-CoA dehydrogenase family protein [Acidimicrobiales bacterium]|jgi:alkylation response protein AidB-like acyl-CoA dehydrogenase|nr:acyl-CoA dehydrogenase family protein [Acidimicrobiales bacterium]